jgi:hypothetical protein
MVGNTDSRAVAIYQILVENEILSEIIELQLGIPQNHYSNYRQHFRHKEITTNSSTAINTVIEKISSQKTQCLPWKPKWENQHSMVA